MADPEVLKQLHMRMVPNFQRALFTLGLTPEGYAKMTGVGSPTGQVTTSEASGTTGVASPFDAARPPRGDALDALILAETGGPTSWPSTTGGHDQRDDGGHPRRSTGRGPRLFTPPDRELTPETSLGYSVIAFSENVLGIKLFPWQKWFYIHALELREDGRLRFKEIHLTVARQNSKTRLSRPSSSGVYSFTSDHDLILGAAQNRNEAFGTWTQVRRRPWTTLSSRLG